jgi:DHA2 family multidrug resistance protein
MPLVGYLLGRGWDGRWMLVFGFTVAGIAFFGYSHMDLDSGTWDILLHLLNQGAGLAFIFVPLTVLAMDQIPKHETGYATSLYSVMRNIGSSIGVSFVTTWIARRSQFNQSLLAAHVTDVSPVTRQALEQAQRLFVQGGADPVTASHRAQAMLYGAVQQQAALLSFLSVFRLMGFLFLLIIPFVFLFQRQRRHPARS